MRSHRFDPISLVFGVAFATAAIVVLAGGSLTDDGQLLLPATLLALGVAVLIQNAARNRPSRPAIAAPTTTGDDHDDNAIDDWSAIPSPLDDTSTTFRTASGVYWPGASPDSPPDPDNPDSLGGAEPTEAGGTGDSDSPGDGSSESTEPDDRTRG